MSRFERTELLVGTKTMKKLESATVLVVGLGAVGSYAAEALARGGIGNLRLVDPDVIRLSNINRQLFALESTLGRNKAHIAKERVLDINPECSVKEYVLAAGADTYEELLRGNVDGVLDAIDDVPAKVGLLAEAHHLGIQTIVSAMGAATRLSPELVRCADLSKTTHCPLAKHIRKALKQRNIRRGIQCVYSIEDPRNEGMTSKPDELPERTPLGSMSCLPGIFGLTAAHFLLQSLMKCSDGH